MGNKFITFTVLSLAVSIKGKEVTREAIIEEAKKRKLDISVSEVEHGMAKLIDNGTLKCSGNSYTLA